MAFWRATDVDLPQNSAIVTVNTGDDVGTITSGYIIQINTGQFLEVKTVNTGASPQTIELYQIYTGTAINGGTAIAAPTQGAIKEATEELRNLRTTYETLADSVSSTATANSVVKRNSSAQVLVANATANNHAMAFGQYTDPLDYGMAGFSGLTNTAPNSNLDEVVETQIIRADNANDKPANSTNGATPGMMFNVNRFAAATAHAATQLCFGFENGADFSSSIWHRGISGTSGAGPWYEVYDSGNTNFNEVIGDGTTGLVLWGQAYNSSEIRFYVPIFKNKVATGITVQGTFSLSYYQNPILSGVGGGSGGIEFLSSSRNIAVIRIAGLSNLDLSRQYNVFAEQSSAKITVNF